jgi:DNA-binding SARP family transcriptional activator
MLEFRVLGPFEARDGDRVLPVGRGKPTALLALLLLHANEVLSVDRLIDDLWGERPTSTARKALQVYVANLRKVLGAKAIVTRSPGYELRLEPDAIDLHRFEDLVDEARAALAAGDANAASALLSDALALWRGPPLADLAFERFAQPEIARLDELRLAAIEERVEADLALGRHGELVPELERLMAEHPVRERLRGQLMLAHYRCGRQVDALDAYQAARDALVDELGIEPGPALRELQRLILVQDPSLATPALAEAPSPPPPVPEERKLVTVLCAACEAGAELEHDPERLRLLLDRVRAAAGEEIEAAGGRPEEGASGCLLASFGAPAAYEDHAERAVHAALAVRGRLERLCGAELALRIGVETGDVVVGARDPGRSAVVGAPFDAALRLAAAAEAGEVRLGARAAAAVGGAFEVRARNGARLVVRALAVARPRGLQGLGRVFVGRQAELDLLRVTQERAVRAARPHLVAILGEAGVGKTSLVRALRQQLATEVSWHVGRCPAYGRAITYRPLAEVLRGHLGVREDEAPDRVRARLADRSILGLTLGLEPGEELHPWEARKRLEEASVQLMDEIAAEGPAVVVLEDLHWAEDALLELLDRVARRASGPLLLLVTARPELLGRDPGFGTGRGNASRLWLEPLSADEADQMLDALGGELPTAVRELVLGLGEGNPFFVEEALASLLDRGILRRSDGGWVAGELPEALAASDSVQAVIAARIDVLPEPERQALQAASVAGRSFWEGAVRSLLDRPDLDLELLEERDFVRRRARSSIAGERELGFKHALTREVAYGSLTLGHRARLHAGFAEWLERIGGGRDEHAPLLAHHYAQAVAPALADLAWSDHERAAELRGKAVRWSRRAAELAIGRYEIDSALALLDEALALERDDGARSELWRLVAWAHQSRFDTDARRGALERALALAPAPAATAQILAELAHAGSGPWLWREPPPRELVEEWTGRALGLAEPGTWAHGLALVARARADFASGLQTARKAAAIAARIGDPLLQTEAYQACAWATEASGALQEGGRWIDRTLAVLPRVRDPAERETILFAAGFAYLRLGRIREASRLAAEHDEIATRLSAHQEVHGVAMDVLIDVVAGDWEAARTRTARAEVACAANRDTPCQFDWRTLLMCALAQARLGDEAEARRLEELAAAELVVGGPAAREPALLRLALLRDDRDAVDRLLAENPGPSLWDADYRAARLDALVAVRDRERIGEEAPALIALGGYVEPFALRALGLARGERALLERAAERFDAMGLGWRAAETRAATPLG